VTDQATRYPPASDGASPYQGFVPRSRCKICNSYQNSDKLSSRHCIAFKSEPGFNIYRMIQKFRSGCKVCCLIAALALPSLAYAKHGIDWGKDPDRGRGGDHKIPPVSSVPEANTGLALIPVMGVILLVSSIQLLRTRKA